MNGQKTYRPAWRSFYWHILAIIALLVLVAWATVKAPQNAWIKWLWIGYGIFVVLAFLDMFVKRLQTRFIVRPNEVALEKGIVSHDSIEIAFNSIRTIQVQQSFIQRILNVGSILVASSGTDNYEINARNILNPHYVRNSMQSHESNFIASETPEENKKQS